MYHLVWICVGSLGVGKASADGLELDEVADARSGESDTILYLRHSVSMWSLVSMSHWPHGHAVVSWGEYLALYSPIGA